MQKVKEQKIVRNNILRYASIFPRTARGKHNVALKIPFWRRLFGTTQYLSTPQGTDTDLQVLILLESAPISFIGGMLVDDDGSAVIEEFSSKAASADIELLPESLDRVIFRAVSLEDCKENVLVQKFFGRNFDFFANCHVASKECENAKIRIIKAAKFLNKCYCNKNVIINGLGFEMLKNVFCCLPL